MCKNRSAQVSHILTTLPAHLLFTPPAAQINELFGTVANLLLPLRYK